MGANGFVGTSLIRVIIMPNTIIVTEQRLQITRLVNRYNKMPKLNLNMVIVFYFASIVFNL
jgi:hypothetical protein